MMKTFSLITMLFVMVLFASTAQAQAVPRYTETTYSVQGEGQGFTEAEAKAECMCNLDFELKIMIATNPEIQGGWQVNLYYAPWELSQAAGGVWTAQRVAWTTWRVLQ